MKIKKILLILLILLVLTSSVDAITNYAQYLNGQWIVSGALSKLPVSVQKLFSAITDPKSFILQNGIKDQKAINIVNGMSRFNSYKDKFFPDIKDPKKKPGLKIREDGEEVITSPDGKTEIFGYKIAEQDKTFWEYPPTEKKDEKDPNILIITFSRKDSSVNSKTPKKDADLIRKKRSARCNDKGILKDPAGGCDTIKIADAEINIGNQKGEIVVKVNQKTQEKTITLKDVGGGSATIRAGKDVKTQSNFAYVSQGAILKLDKSNNLVYANFKSSANGLAKSNIYYKDKNYQFEIKNRGVLYFDPKNTEKKGNAIAASGDVTLTIGSKKYLTKNGFIIFLDEDGNGIIRRIDYPANGAFIDTDYQIQATSTSKGCFSVFFGNEKIVKYYSSKKYSVDLPNDCKGKIPTNTLWIDYDALIVQGKSAMVKLVSTGQINYKYGKYIAVEGQPGSRTILIKRPGHEFYFKVTNGWAAIEKDHIRATVTNKCKTTKLTPTGYAANLGVINNCGDNVQLHRTGIVSIITETVNIVDSCGTCMYIIGPEGGIYAYNKKTGKQIGSWFNPQKSKLGYGELYLKGSRELTIIAIFDYLIQDMTNFQNGLKYHRLESIGGVWDFWTAKNLYLYVAHGQTVYSQKLDAIRFLQAQANMLNLVRQKMLEGNSFRDASKIAGLNQQFTNLLEKSVKENGEINPDEMLKLATSVVNWNEINDNKMSYSLNQAYYFGQLSKEAIFDKIGVYDKNELTSKIQKKFPDTKVVLHYVPWVDNKPSPPKITLSIISPKYVPQDLKKTTDLYSIPIKVTYPADDSSSKTPTTLWNYINKLKIGYPNAVSIEEERLAKLYEKENLFTGKTPGWYNADSSPTFLVPLIYKIDNAKFNIKLKEVVLSSVDILDLIPVLKIAKIGSKGWYAAKSAIKTKGFRKAYSEFYENTLKTFVKRPYIILKDSYETLGKAEFKEEDALSRLWHCSGDCEKNIKNTVNEKIDNVMGDGTTSAEKQADKRMAEFEAKAAKTGTKVAKKTLPKIIITGPSERPFMYLPKSGRPNPTMWLIKDENKKTIGYVKEVYPDGLLEKGDIIMTYAVEIQEKALQGKGYGTQIATQWGIAKINYAKELKRRIILRESSAVYESARTAMNAKRIINKIEMDIKISTKNPATGKDIIFENMENLENFHRSRPQAMFKIETRFNP